MATYLITGVAGFIGSHLADALLEAGHRVRGFDNLTTGRRENVAREVDFLVGDLADETAIARACRDVDAVFHQAALPSVPRSVKSPRPSHMSNLQGTFNLLEGARAAGVKRVLYAASSSAYGNGPGMPRVETMLPSPISPYAVQKLAGELYMQSYARVYGMETVSLRYFNVFGPRQTPDAAYAGVIAKWSLSMLKADADDVPVINGDGEQARDFTYIANVVGANLLAMAAPAERVTGRVFNVACGQRRTLNEVYASLARLTNYNESAVREKDRAGDVRESLADITAARDAFGYEPTVAFNEGLERTVAWQRGQIAAKDESR